MASSLEGNKIAAAVLTAGVIAMFSGFAAELLYHPKPLEQNVYVVAVDDAADAGGTEAAAAPVVELIGPLLATADPANGEKVAKKCTACHTFEAGGANKIGPNLYDIVNRPIASHDGFAYSPALTEMADSAWDYESLSAFLLKPKDWAPGTKMSFAGLRKSGDRADIIAYMRGFSDNPAPLPE